MILLFCSFSLSAYASPRRNFNATGERDNLADVHPSIEFEHHKNHEGYNFEVHIESALVSVANIVCAFRVPPSNKSIHMVIDWKAEDKAHSEIFEGAVWSTDTGTVLEISNNNRNSTITSILEEDKTATPAWTANGVLMDPTGIVGGTSLHSDYSYIAKQAGGATSLPRHEWILKNDETYVIKVTNDAGGNKLMGIILHWYENINK